MKRPCSVLLDKPLEGCEILKTEELAEQPLELPARKFLVFRNTEEGQDLSKVSPFLIIKAINGRAGPLASIQKLQNVTLLVNKWPKARIVTTKCDFVL